jgi:hypothetical protein
MTKAGEKNKAEMLKAFLIKTGNLLLSKLQKKPSPLKREHRALQKMKFFNFFVICPPVTGLRIRIRNTDL